jgi:hypothetical protein
VFQALPSAFYRGTRQSNILPSVALGKIFWHSVKPGTRQTWSLPSPAALGKPCTRQKVAGGHGGHLPSNFAECLTAGARQIFFIFFKSILPSAITQALGIFFLFF